MKPSRAILNTSKNINWTEKEERNNKKKKGKDKLQQCVLFYIDVYSRRSSESHSLPSIWKRLSSRLSRRGFAHISINHLRFLSLYLLFVCYFLVWADKKVSTDQMKYASMLVSVSFALIVPFLNQLAVKPPSSTRSCRQQWLIQCPALVPKEPSNRARAITANVDRREPTGNGADARITSSSASNSLASLSTPERKAATSVTWWTCTTTKLAEW